MNTSTREDSQKVDPLPSGENATEHCREEFRRLSSAWQKETAHFSSMGKAEKHPAYQEIILLGREVVPFLLRDMAENHTHWFAALEKITGAKPTSAATAGNIPKMVEAWLRWAQDNGYQW